MLSSSLQSLFSPFLELCSVFISSVTILSLYCMVSSSLQSPSCLYTAWYLHLFSHRSLPFECCIVSSSLQSPSCPFLVLCGVCIYPVILFSLFGSCLVSWALLGRFPVPLCIVSSFLQSEILSLSFNYFFSDFNPSVTFVSISSTV